MRITIIGLTISSSWGNGHATTYRSLAAALHQRGHHVTFLECDRPWYASHRDLCATPYCDIEFWNDPDDLWGRHAFRIKSADAILIGSYVPNGTEVIAAVLTRASSPVLFYDIDTPVTLDALRSGTCEYLHPAQIPRFDAYLSFAGGPILDVLRCEFGAQRALPFYCSVDPVRYFPETTREQRVPSDLGYLGTYSTDRQPGLESYLLEAARQLPKRRFVVAGPQYPADIAWPSNVRRIDHLPPSAHRAFYNGQRFTLNLTRRAMTQAGYSPSVRLFEAAACGVPIISDAWNGIGEFLAPGREILLVQTSSEVTAILEDLPEPERHRIAQAARARILANHSSSNRATEFEQLLTAIRTRLAFEIPIAS